MRVASTCPLCPVSLCSFLQTELPPNTRHASVNAGMKSHFQQFSGALDQAGIRTRYAKMTLTVILGGPVGALPYRMNLWRLCQLATILLRHVRISSDRCRRTPLAALYRYLTRSFPSTDTTLELLDRRSQRPTVLSRFLLFLSRWHLTPRTSCCLPSHEGSGKERMCRNSASCDQRT